MIELSRDIYPRVMELGAGKWEVGGLILWRSVGDGAIKLLGSEGCGKRAIGARVWGGTGGPEGRGKGGKACGNAILDGRSACEVGGRVR